MHAATTTYAGTRGYTCNATNPKRHWCVLDSIQLLVTYSCMCCLSFLADFNVPSVYIFRHCLSLIILPTFFLSFPSRRINKLLIQMNWITNTDLVPLLASWSYVRTGWFGRFHHAWTVVPKCEIHPEHTFNWTLGPIDTPAHCVQEEDGEMHGWSGGASAIGDQHHM